MKYLTPFKWGRTAPSRQYEEHPIASFQRAINSLFDDFFKGFDVASVEEKLGSFNPKIDMTEDEKELQITAELPGIDEKDIEVSLLKNVLTISGEKSREKEEKSKESYFMERSYGSFKRSIQLPAEVEQEKIDAAFKKGILTISLPKAAKEVPEQKKIHIKNS